MEEREMEILACVAAGKSSHVIAREVFMSIDGVKRARSRLYRVLGAVNSANAVHIAHEKGLLPHQPAEEES
jgi:DNA-binding CsgD family transcriptional regulator